MDKITVGFIGLGLIGGSIARAMKKFRTDCYLMAYSHTTATLKEAIDAGVIDVALIEHDPRFSECDYIFLCAPVTTNLSYLPFLSEIIKPSCIITDVGSVKGEIHREVQKIRLIRNFIGGHPMAGSEKTGFANSTDYLLENAYYVITPESEIEISALSDFVELVRSLKAIPMVLTYEEHDYVTAAVSHLPHIVAATLVNTLEHLDTPEEYMKMIAAGGFKDITRIASSSPVMWQQICASNREQISRVLDAYIRALVQAKYLVDNQKTDDIFQMFESAKDYRDSLPDMKSMTSRMYVLYCDLYDETGGIAAVTTLLAKNDINIKNIGIIHNREFEEGVLRIEFYQADACDRAKTVLEETSYRVHLPKN